MNTQNILKYYGTKLDVRLDSSEFYDYEISKVQDDYDVDVLDLTQPITYESLKISTTLEDYTCVRDTISLYEIDNTGNDPDYPYSGLTAVVGYDDFTTHIDTTFSNIILNDNVFTYTGITDEIHYFSIAGYNLTQQIDPNFGVADEEELINGFLSGSTEVLKCVERLESTNNCCPLPHKLNNKPWAYQFKDNKISGCTEYISRRVEKGWTLDFIFNREELSWSNGGVFYYFGVRGTSSGSEYGDNNLSFRFTNDGRIRWTAVRYSGVCINQTFTESFYVDTDQTVPLCTTGGTKDFNITIVFDRYKRFTDCDLENHGGWNDMLGWSVNDYSDTVITAVTSTQLASYNMTDEVLNKKWSDEKQRRLGTLKIYLNGRPIYKKENWEEVIPSNRGPQPFIQSWGGGTGMITSNHEGACCFNMKSIKYYEEPLDFVHVRHNFITRLNQYDFFICGGDCEDELIGLYADGLLTENSEYTLTEDNNVIIY